MAGYLDINETGAALHTHKIIILCSGVSYVI